MGSGHLKWVDIPPVWLALHLAVVWFAAPHAPLRTPMPGVAHAGTVCVAIGLALMLVAIVTMWRAKTTPIPHREAASLVTSGIFGWSRNPIYLGDALVVAGVVLRAEAPVLLVLLLPFVWVITRRFIAPEEARLQRRFGAAFDAYRSRTRRWI